MVDIEDGQPIGYATIVEFTQNKYCTSDADGNFTMDSLCAGTIKLSVRHPDCGDTNIFVQLDISKNQVIKLPHSAIKLSGVDVYGESRQLKFTAASNTITGKEIATLIGGSLADITGNISGVSSLSTGSSISKPMIHGLQGYRILILNNGVRLEAQQWGNEHAPEIDPFIAKKISVIKGAGSLRYGSDALGGVVLIEPEELPDSTEPSGEIHITGNSNGKGGALSGILQGGIKNIDGLSWRLQGTFRKQGNIKTPDYYLSTTALQENNFSYAIGYHKKRWGTEIFYSQFNTNIGIFSGSHIGNLTDLNNAFNGLSNYDTSAFSYQISRPYQEVSHELLKGNFHIHTGKRSRLNLNYSYQYNLRKEFDKDISLNDSLAALHLPDLDYRIETHLTEAVWDHDNIRNLRGSFGASFMHQENVYRGRYFIPNYIGNNFGLFGTERYVHKKLEAEIGLRYDQKYLDTYLWEGDSVIHPSYIFQSWSAQSGIIFKIDSTKNLLFNTALTWRPPGVNELFANGLHHGAASVEKGNRNLKPERGWNTSITFLIKNKKTAFEISAYANYLKNYIYQQPGNSPILTIKGAFPVFYYNQTDALISGLDLEGKYNITNELTLSIKAMYLYGQNLMNQQPLVYMPSNRLKSEIKYQFKNLLNMKNPNLTFACNYVAKQNRIPVNVDYKSPPMEYFLFEVRINAAIRIAKQYAEVNLGVNNLLNSRYRDYLDRFRYYCDAPGRNIYLKLSIPINKNENTARQKQ